MNERRSNRIAAVAVAAVVLILLPFAISWYEASSLSWPHEKFEPAKWKAAPHHERYRQFNDLMVTQKIVGQTRADIEGLLGPPDYVSADGRYMTYDLKEGSGELMTLNSIYFVRIWMDQHSRITDVQVAAD